MLDKLSQEQFEHILELLIMYKQLNNKKEVSLSEKSIKDAFKFMSNEGKELAEQMGISM